MATRSDRKYLFPDELSWDYQVDMGSKTLPWSGPGGSGGESKSDPNRHVVSKPTPHDHAIERLTGVKGLRFAFLKSARAAGDAEFAAELECEVRLGKGLGPDFRAEADLGRRTAVIELTSGGEVNKPQWLKMDLQKAHERLIQTNPDERYVTIRCRLRAITMLTPQRIHLGDTPVTFDIGPNAFAAMNDSSFEPIRITPQNRPRGGRETPGNVRRTTEDTSLERGGCLHQLVRLFFRFP